MESLNKVMSERRGAQQEQERIQKRICQLSQKSKEIQSIGDIQSAYIEAEKKFVALQVAQTENRIELLSQWKELFSVEDDPSEVAKQVQNLEYAIHDEEILESKCRESLKLLQDNAARKPKYLNRERQMKKLFERISRLREKVVQMGSDSRTATISS